MKLTLTDNYCEVLAVIDLNEYDLSKPLAKAAILDEIEEEITRAVDRGVK